MNAREFDAWLLSPNRRPLVMGILNVTPDSFSDGGQYASTDAAIAHARAMIAEGADLLDIGGESTRPGSQRIGAAEQIARVVPAISGIRAVSDIVISVDTTLSRVAEAALNAGANLLNDVSAGREDTGMLTLAARAGVPIVLMHMLGEPGTMQQNPQYNDVTAEVRRFLLERAAAAEATGVAREKIILDPGIGFGKRMEHNLQLLRDTAVIKQLGYRLLVGVSRKRFIGTLTGVERAEDRVIGSCAAGAWALERGADILRVHDVGATCEMVDVVGALLREETR